MVFWFPFSSFLYVQPASWLTEYSGVINYEVKSTRRKIIELKTLQVTDFTQNLFYSFQGSQPQSNTHISWLKISGHFVKIIERAIEGDHLTISCSIRRQLDSALVESDGIANFEFDCHDKWPRSNANDQVPTHDPKSMNTWEMFRAIHIQMDAFHSKSSVAV